MVYIKINITPPGISHNLDHSIAFSPTEYFLSSKTNIFTLGQVKFGTGLLRQVKASCSGYFAQENSYLDGPNFLECSGVKVHVTLVTVQFWMRNGVQKTRHLLAWGLVYFVHDTRQSCCCCTCYGRNCTPQKCEMLMVASSFIFTEKPFSLLTQSLTA